MLSGMPKGFGVRLDRGGSPLPISGATNGLGPDVGVGTGETLTVITSSENLSALSSLSALFIRDERGADHSLQVVEDSELPTVSRGHATGALATRSAGRICGATGVYAQEHTAIDDERRAGDVIGGVAREELHGAGDVLRRAGATPRNRRFVLA